MCSVHDIFNFFIDPQNYLIYIKIKNIYVGELH